MAKTIQWQGHGIEIDAFISPKYLMLAGETLLKVDGKETFRTGGFHFSEMASGTFYHNGNPLPIELQLQGGFLSINYLLKIADNEVSQGRLHLDRIGWACFFWALIGLILGSLGTVILQSVI